MPPLPATFDEETLEVIASVQRRQNALSEYQIPRLRACEGPLSVQQNLASELREDLDVITRQVDTLEMMIDDQKGAKNKRELAGLVGTLKEELATIRKDTRDAILASKKTIDAQRKSRRDELLGSSVVREKASSKGDPEDALMKANDDVTEALRRTIGLMQGELERSVLSTQMLDASTASLRATSSTHDTLTNVMGTSKQLITALEKSDWIDRILIISALVFFFLVVLFILKQRVLDRTFRVAFWWTRFLPSVGGSTDDHWVDVEKSAVSTMASAVASTMTSVVATVVSGSGVSSVSLPEASDSAHEGALSTTSISDISSLIDLDSIAPSETLASEPTVSETPRDEL